MKIGSKEHYEILDVFERNYSHLRLDREPEESWPQGTIYQCGETNNLYKAFISGYSLGRCVYLAYHDTEKDREIDRLQKDIDLLRLDNDFLRNAPNEYRNMSNTLVNDNVRLEEEIERLKFYEFNYSCGPSDCPCKYESKCDEINKPRRAIFDEFKHRAEVAEKALAEEQRARKIAESALSLSCIYISNFRTVSIPFEFEKDFLQQAAEMEKEKQNDQQQL